MVAPPELLNNKQTTAGLPEQAHADGGNKVTLLDQVIDISIIPCSLTKIYTRIY
jgi:hypothetical protein